MSTSLNELAKILPDTVHIVSNFLLSDDKKCSESTSTNLTDDELDTEKRVVFDAVESSDDMGTDQLDSDVAKIQRHWLRNTLIVACPNLDLLVIASTQKFVILERSKRTSLMEIAAKIRMKFDDEEEQDSIYISALSAFGLAPQSSNASSRSLAVDWNCICIGLSNGQLQFYTERGILLFSEKCSALPILSIRLGPSANPGNQELVILTADSKLIVIEGLSLCVALRTARNHIAHGERSAHELSGILQLNAQQLQLDKLRRVNDVQLAGLTRLNAFDQYVSAYFAGGRKESISHTQLPIYAQYICAIGSRGKQHEEEISVKNDFIAFLWHDAQSNSGNLVNALFSLTSRLTNNIPSFGFRSFIGVGVSRKDRPQKQWLGEAQTTNIYMKSWIRDGKRLAERTFLAPYGWHLVAVTDNVGRVLLIHTRQKRILRIWKGYRQARCAWLEIESDVRNEKVRTLFLVIFAPRRGLLEIFSLQNGPRVSTFEVGDCGRLLAIPSAQCGVLHGGLAERDIPGSTFPTTAGVVFLSPNGSFYSVNTPFHLSALDSSATLVHDESLLKQFNIKIDDKNSPELADKMLQFFAKIKTNIGKRRFLDTLLRLKNIQMVVLAEFISKLAEKCECTKSNELQNPPKEQPNFNQYLLNTHKAIRNFIKLKQLFVEAADSIEQNSAPSSVIDWEFVDTKTSNSNILKALKELKLVGEFEKRHSHTQTPVVDFSSHCLDFSEFIDHLNLEKGKASCDCSKSTALWQLGATLFSPLLLNSRFAESIKDCFNAFGFDKEQLITLFHSFWLNNGWTVKPEEYANQSYQILKLIFLDDSISNGADAEMSQIITAMKIVEKAIFESTNTKAATILSLQMSALEQEMLARSTIFTDANKETFISLEDAHLEWQAGIEDANCNFWTLSAVHLGALSILHFLSSLKGDNSGSINLSKMAQKGVGFYSEQIAIFISQIGLNSDQIVSILNAKFGDEANSEDGQMDREEEELSMALNLLCSEIFPQSLRIELILCDLVWENVSVWTRVGHRAIHNLEHSIEFLDRIQSVPKMQHGLAVMIWDTFFSKTFENLFCLMEEQLGLKQAVDLSAHSHPLVGRDCFLKGKINVSEADLPIYLSCVRRLLEILAEASRQIEGRRDIAYGPLAGNLHKQDAAIHGFIVHHRTRRHLSNSEREPMTLVHLADRQKLVNYHLVVHHFHLAAVIELQLLLPFKSHTKPSVLFDSNTGRRAFFSNLSTHPLLLIARVDDRTKARRQRFLEQCAEAVREDGGEIVDNNSKIRHLLDSLVMDWKMDAANIRIKEVLRLYLSGQDEEAETRSGLLVGNRRKLTFELIPIIAARIKMLMDKEERLLEKIHKRSAASEGTLSLIKSIPQEDHRMMMDVEASKTRKMIALAKSCLNTKEKAPQPADSDQINFDRCRQLLREFDEICVLAQWLEREDNNQSEADNM